MIIIYTRQSVERVNSISCETQKEHCLCMIKPDEKDEEVLTLVDSGFSGGNTERDGFRRMMDLVHQGKVSKVIVYKVDRLSRSLVDFVGTLQEFKQHHVQFVSSQESFDSSTPYGELILKILIVFAEFERSSIINRITQAYEHRSSMGFYMGGKRPFGFRLVPTVIQGIATKKMEPIPEEATLLHWIFHSYAEEHLSLRQLQKLLLSREQEGKNWSSAKLSAIIKNPIYVRADSDVYDYYESRGVQIKSELSLFSGLCGAQLYGRSKHDANNPDWSDMKLVLLTHEGLIDSDIWIKCQHKLEKNRQITRSYSNHSSWLAGKVICRQCGHSMTTIKGKPNRFSQVRRYFNCTGKSHKGICSGPQVTVYAEDLEQLLDECISEKLSGFPALQQDSSPVDSNMSKQLKLKLKAIAQAEQRLMERLLADNIDGDLLALANQKASQLKQQRTALEEQLKTLHSPPIDKNPPIDLVKLWKNADYLQKKSAAALLLHQILIAEDGAVCIIWNI